MQMAAGTRDPGRPARVQREAEILASPNPPGIAIIHGMVEEGKLRAVVNWFEELRRRVPLGK